MSDLELTMMRRVGELKADLRNCYTAIRVKDEENARLKAEVERLRKAGDAMAEALEAAGFNNARDFWNAAKEGKGQP